jgi:hypothetical protein
MPLPPIHEFCQVSVLNFVDTLFSQSSFLFPCHGNGAAVSDPDYQPEKSQEVYQDSYKTQGEALSLW